MSGKEDKFYSMFKDSLEGYSPEVPAVAYTGLRKRMRYNNFFRLSMTSLNIWLIAGVIGIGTGVGYCYSQSENIASAKSIEFDFAASFVPQRDVATMILVQDENRNTETEEIVVNKSTKSVQRIATPITVEKLDASSKRNNDVIDEIERAVVTSPLKEDKVEEKNELPAPVESVVAEEAEPALEETVDVEDIAVKESSNLFQGLINFFKFQPEENGINDQIKDNDSEVIKLTIKVQSNKE